MLLCTPLGSNAVVSLRRNNMKARPAIILLRKRIMKLASCGAWLALPFSFPSFSRSFGVNVLKTCFAIPNSCNGISKLNCLTALAWFAHAFAIFGLP